MKGSYQAVAFLFMVLLTCEAITWIVVAPDTAFSRMTSIFVGFVVFIIVLVFLVLAVLNGDGL